MKNATLSLVNKKAQITLELPKIKARILLKQFASPMSICTIPEG